MAGPLVERFRARCNQHQEPVCSPAFQTLVLPTAESASASVSPLFPISDQNRGDCYQRAVDISRAGNVSAIAGHGQYEGLRGFSITLPVGQTPSFDMVAIGNGSIGYGGHASNQPLYFGNPTATVTRQTTAAGGTVEWLHRGGDMPMAISREVSGDQCTYRVWFMDQANSSQRGGIVSLTQPDGSTRYSMVALDRIPPPAAPEVAATPVVAPPPRAVERPAVVAPPVVPAAPALGIIPAPRPAERARPPSSDDPILPAAPAVPAAPSPVPPSDRPITPPMVSLSSNPFVTRGFVDETGMAFELRPVSGAVANRLTQLTRMGGVDRDGTTHVALDERHSLVSLPAPAAEARQDYLLVENRGTPEAPQFVAASVRLVAPGIYRRNDDSWQLDFGAVSRTIAHAKPRLRSVL